MNRWIVPLLSLVAVAGATAATTFAVPALQPPAAEVPTDDARLSVLCPTVTSATATVEVAAMATGPGLRTASLPDVQAPKDAEGITVLTAPAGPQVVSGLRSTTFGAVSAVRATAGPERGLSGATCSVPATEQWFTAVGMSENEQADLVLTNIDSVDAIVDVTAYGPQGRIASQGVRGIVVAAASTRTVPLSVVASSPEPVGVQVVSDQGRVAASLREHLWDGSTPLGTDWIPATAAPAKQVVIPGIPDGDGLRRLVVTNPGERTTGIDLSVLTADGSNQLPGLENLEVPAGTTRAFDLTDALAGEPAALSLTADYPVTAAVRAASPGTDRSDPVWLAGLPPIGGDGVWLLPSAQKTEAVLQFANSGAAEVKLRVTIGTSQPVEVKVPADGIATTPVPSAATVVIRVQGAGRTVHGALVAREDLGKIRGIAALPLVTSESSIVVPQTVFDPHAG